MADKYYFKVHKHPSEMVIAICDEELLGQTFQGEKMKLTVSEGFYGGVLADEDFVLTNIRSFTILNVVGDRIVDLCIRQGIVSVDSVMDVGGIKHAQAVRM
ncbi:MAG: DUF424 family protein [archaeon]|nr:DUF424 family protein [archaeon]